MPYSLHQEYLYQRLGISQDSNKHHLAEELRKWKQEKKATKEKKMEETYITGMKL
jgi:hypothetical protein